MKVDQGGRKGNSCLYGLKAAFLLFRDMSTSIDLSARKVY
jgi:hypothetical protein